MTIERTDQPPKKRGFGMFDTTIEPEIECFQSLAYPDRERSTILPKWRWMFVQSASRLGVEPIVWVYRKDGGIVAHQGAMPVRIKVGSRELVARWFVETMALEPVRNTGIGSMLVRKALEDLPFNISLGQTEQMRALQFALGWKEIRRLSRFVFLTSTTSDFRGRLPRGLSELAAFAAGSLHLSLLAARTLRGRRTFRCERVNRFGDDHDRLWRSVSNDLDCSVVRDASYLNWKYIDRPGANFVCLHLKRDDEIVALAVLAVRSPSDVYADTRGLIVDIVAPPSQSGVTAAMLAESLGTLRELGAKLVVCYAAGAWLERALARFGFLRTEEAHHFLVADGGMPPDLVSRLRSPDAWYLTAGDSDLDAYAQ
jgi:hypothetical protein